MAEAQRWMDSDFSPSKLLCSKCQIALLPVKNKVLPHQDISPQEKKTFLVHSESISSLNDTRLNSCHLCVHIWEARGTEFRRLLKLEKDHDDKEKKIPEVNEANIESENDKGKGKIGESPRTESVLLTALLYRWKSTPKSKPRAQRWDHEYRRLHFVISTGINFTEGYCQEMWLEYYSEFDRIWNRDNQLTFWMTHVTNSRNDLRYPPHDCAWISPDTGSEGTHVLAKAWISNCLTQHTQCKRGQELRAGWNPTRVLDVQASDVASGIRLWEPTTTTGQIDYVTLSHSWGKPDFVTLTADTYDDFKVEIKKEILTKTFSDAVATTRKLGIRYLWIDSLCIIQGSVEDWQREASMMGEVYKYGYCNLAGARYEQSRGLYTGRNPLVITPLILRLENGAKPDSKEELYIFHRQFNEWCDLDDVPLNRRAWVLQERIMSPRTLSFGSNQVSWECCEALASEAWPTSHVSNDGHDTTMKKRFSQLYGQELVTWEDTLGFWFLAIDEFYSRTNITNDEDRLIAISGLAKLIYHRTEVEYLAGLWNFHLEHQLLWEVSNKVLTKRAEDAIAPSWSWASVVGRVHNYSFIWTKKTQQKLRVKFLRTQVDLIIRGQLAHGVVGMRGPQNKWDTMLGASFDTVDVDDTKAYSLLLFEDPVKTDPTAKGLSNSLSNSLNRFRGRVDLYGLMLLPTGRKKGEFTRCGVFCIQDIIKNYTKRLRREFKDFCAKAEDSGLPYEKTKNGNEFVVTIV